MAGTGPVFSKTIGIITGSGVDALPGLGDGTPDRIATPWGEVALTRARLAGVEVVHVSRHGPGHARLSNHLEHRATIWALREARVAAVIGASACGAVDPSLPLGSLVVFDDVFFPSNRLPDGSLCTFFTEPGDPARAHWILHGSPLAGGVRRALLAGAGATGAALRDGGVYGHVDGPRFNTPSEIAWLRSAGVVAVSQTGGPEAVLCGELELPYGLLGFVTDYANEVRPGEPTPVALLGELIARSGSVFASALTGAVPALAADGARPAGTVFRIGGG